jgi:hypothetical protein
VTANASVSFFPQFSLARPDGTHVGSNFILDGTHLISYFFLARTRDIYIVVHFLLAGAQLI